MTETNLFQEVQEDLERQRLEALWKRYGNMAVMVMLAVILATAAYSTYTSWQTRKNQEATGQLLLLLSAEDMGFEKRIKALREFSDMHGATSQGVMALLEIASLESKQGHSDRAVALYDGIANNRNADASFQQFARLMSVREQMDTGNPTELMARLDPLTVKDAPWQAEAKEYQAYLALRLGDNIKAKQIFTDLSQDVALPHSLNERAASMLRYLDQ
jgi:hypothetical protein